MKRRRLSTQLSPITFTARLAARRVAHQTCRTIEQYAREALEDGFPEELQSEMLEWHAVNVEEPQNEHFIGDYELLTRSLVLVDVEGGNQTRWKNLERVWELVGDKGAFISYVQKETRAYRMLGASVYGNHFHCHRNLLLLSTHLWHLLLSEKEPLCALTPLERRSMLIEDYDLEVTSVPCEPGSEEFAAIVRLNVDIGPALPYLNQTLRRAVYIAQAPSLAWKKGGRNIAFWPYKIAIGHLEDRAQAQKVAQGLVNLVNRTWTRREGIKPDYEMHRRPGPLEVYKLLPQTNCKACGQPTCYIFASKLVMGHVKLEACPVLQEPQYAAQLAQLADMLVIDMPAVGPKDLR